jgi:uncharacterized protein
MKMSKMSVRKAVEDDIQASKNWSTWTKEVSVFVWKYDKTETCYILEGKAEATDQYGNKIEFQAGDLVRFEKGLHCTWKITSPIRKKYLFS